MIKISVVGAVLIILGICAADSASIIPTVLLCSVGVGLLIGDCLWHSRQKR